MVIRAFLQFVALVQPESQSQVRVILGPKPRDKAEACGGGSIAGLCTCRVLRCLILAVLHVLRELAEMRLIREFLAQFP